MHLMRDADALIENYATGVFVLTIFSVPALLTSTDFSSAITLAYAGANTLCGLPLVVAGIKAFFSLPGRRP
jgi:hypothetical protein